MRFRSLGSGSEGNALLIECGAGSAAVRLLLDCGFSDVKYYWEGSTEDGEGNEIWSLATAGEGCDTWHAYIVALK